jgi:phosphopantetheinyl transferase
MKRRHILNPLDRDNRAKLNILIAKVGDLPEQACPGQTVSGVSVAPIRPESAAARKLVATALHSFLGRTPAPGELAGEMRAEGGKPYYPAFPDFHYNISHSGSYAVCAYCTQPVGIDLQKIPEDPHRILLIAKRFFSSEEQEALRELQGKNEPEAMCRLFCRYWTARESYIKLTGRGLAEPFENFRPDLEKGVILVLKKGGGDQCPAGSEKESGSGIPASDPEGTAETFYLSEYPAPGGYCLTVCSTVPLQYELA